MRILIFVCMALLVAGCASQKRTKWTDKTMRVMIDPDSISAEHYVKISSALVRSGKFVVVDRSAGFNAIKREQERTHRHDVDRFADREKYAHWGKLYGVGGVVVAHADCHHREGTFTGRYKLCKQYVAIMDTNTAEVIAVAEGESDGDAGDDTVPWDDVVADLEVAYPKYFEKDRTEAKLEEYKQLSKEEALRTKEEQARAQIDAERKQLQREREEFEREKALRQPASVEAPSLPELPKVESKPVEAPQPQAEAPKPAQANPEPVAEQKLPEQASDVAKEQAEKLAKKEGKE